MARILYIFPHPDDESFGPAPAIARQIREGHEVHLLTLTRGEATTQRERLGLSKEEMGEVRFQEMKCVTETLELTGMTVLQLPDGKLADMDPQEVEDVVAAHVREVEPDVVVTYAIHGISGHRDHLVCHAVVKRVFCDLRDELDVQRLALFTLPEGDGERPDHLTASPSEMIDCVIELSEDDLQKGYEALDCYETYKEVVEEHQPLEQVKQGVVFEFFGESFDPPLDDLAGNLTERKVASI